MVGKKQKTKRQGKISAADGMAFFKMGWLGFGIGIGTGTGTGYWKWEDERLPRAQGALGEGGSVFVGVRGSGSHSICSVGNLMSGGKRGKCNCKDQGYAKWSTTPCQKPSEDNSTPTKTKCQVQWASR